MDGRHVLMSRSADNQAIHIIFDAIAVWRNSAFAMSGTFEGSTRKTEILDYKFWMPKNIL